MLIFLIAAVVGLITSVMALFQRRWKSSARRMAAAIFCLGIYICYILSWNAVMLKVDRDATTRAASIKGSCPFQAVFIDASTEKQFGPFPYDRAFYARGIRELDRLGAKAVVVKFFLDQRKSDSGDSELSKAFSESKAKILLEATLNHGETAPNPLPPRFDLGISIAPATDVIGGNEGWIPLPDFAAHASDIGFVDIRDPQFAPVIEMYEGKCVKSLFTRALEAGFGSKAEIVPGNALTIGPHHLKLTTQSEIPIDSPAQDTIESISYADLLNAKVPDDKIRDRVIILGLDTPTAPMVKTEIGPIGIHRWFWHMLNSAYQKAAAN